MCQLGEHIPIDTSCPEFSFQKNIQLLAADRNILLKETREILSTNRAPPSSSLNPINPPPHSSSPETPSSFNFDNSSSPPYSPPPLRPSYVYAATSKPSLNKQYNNPLPFQPFTSTNRPVYLLELNGRTLLRPPDGCAYPLPPSGPLFPVYSANLPANNQISVILQFLVQIINMFSFSTSSLLPTGQPCLPSSQTFNYQRHSHPSDFNSSYG